MINVNRYFIETERLKLRKLEIADFDNLCTILQDDEVMYAYEGAFDKEQVQQWLDRQLTRYQGDGIGLYAVILKKSGEFIGQCGLTMQDYKETKVMEVGYLFRKMFWHKGYATEAAIACREYAFNTLNATELFSIIRDTNSTSQKVAVRNGMVQMDEFVKHYRGVDMPHLVFSVRRTCMMFHSFTGPIAGISLPEKFTYPFHYSPHPLCVRAAEELQAYLNSQKQWQDELRQGKMFGVLIVRTDEGDIGYLAAFSGILAGKNLHTYFVPPIYDLQQPQGFFKQEEDHISAINAQIQNLQADKPYLAARQQLTDETTLARQILAEARANLKAAREAREMHRLTHPDETKRAVMIRESQHQKAEYKRLEQYWKSHIAGLQIQVDAFDSQIERLKTERKTRSAALQLKLFEQFRILNARGEIKNLCNLFEQTLQKTPPAGAGECAAPKLLQYAYRHHLTPLAMAEFWWGDSPKAEIRRHGYYYPACKGKCEPILRHMLQGLDVDPNPLLDDLRHDTKLEILFEDTWLLAINKPTGLLTVPGKGNTDSVYKWLKTRYPEATGPLIVHRLDMATSGVLLIAKTKEVHQNLQAQFKNRTIKKRYVALLDGIIHTKEGVIELPLCLNPLDRPRQIVSEEFGKPAQTKYVVAGEAEGRTRIVFYPLTGRTHQLRVHAAHLLGLNCPIIGDELYGKKADRLYLHAEYVEFRHPISGEIIGVERKADF